MATPYVVFRLPNWEKLDDMPIGHARTSTHYLALIDDLVLPVELRYPAVAATDPSQRYYAPDYTQLVLANPPYNRPTRAETVSIAPNYAPETKVELCIDLVDLFANYVEKGCTPVQREKMDINIALILLHAIPGMADSISEYLKNPDIGVTLVSDTSLSTSIKTALMITPVPPRPHSRGLAVAAAFLVVLFMTKGTVSGTHHSEVVKRRLSALAHSLSLRDITIETEAAKRMVPRAFAKEILATFSFYPKLKTAVLMTIMNGRTQLHAHIKMILSHTQLTAFNVIHMFITAEIKTKAHVEGRVLSEMAKYVIKFAEIEGIYGNLWPWCKLINPTEVRTQVTDYPVLSAAAICYQIHINRLHSMHRLMTRATKTAYMFKICSQVLPPDVYMAPQRTALAEAVRERLGEALGIDIKKAIETEDVDEANAEEIRQHLEDSRRVIEEFRRPENEDGPVV